MGLSPHLPLLLCALASAPLAQEAAIIQRRLVAMGTWLHLEVEAADRAAALAASEVAARAIESVEVTLSTWRDDSALARLNAHPVGEPFALAPQLARWLERARGWCDATEGTFDPTVGALVELWGLRAGGLDVPPTDAAVQDALAGVGFARWTLAEEYATRLHPSTRFEEGAFGKGAGLEAALAALAAEGIVAARVDLGGQVAFLGRPAAVDVAHPDRRDLRVATLERPGGSFATTGNSERDIRVAGERLGHVLDPRTGRPAPDWGSVTVWCERALDADALSTALYLMGPERAIAWADDHPGVEALALARAYAGAPDSRLVVRASRAFAAASLDSTHAVQAPPATRSPRR